MTCRQRPSQRGWLIADRPPDSGFWQALRRLPRGSGVLMLIDFGPTERQRLRRWADIKELTLACEGKGVAARVHNLAELRQACRRRIPLILLSPIYATSSHPDRSPLPRMRAATLARLGGRQMIALGGMNERRFRIVRDLGFVGWAGISAWSPPQPRQGGATSACLRI